MKKIKIIKLMVLVLFLSSLMACASRPKLFPNETLKNRGKEAGEADIDKCMKEADLYLDSSEGRKIARSTGFGAAVGGAVGAVAGVFTGNISRGVTQGAAMGGAGGAASGAMSPDEIKHRYVDKCLSEKGYHVLGWD